MVDGTWQLQKADSPGNTEVFINPITVSVSGRVNQCYNTTTPALLVIHCIMLITHSEKVLCYSQITSQLQKFFHEYYVHKIMKVCKSW